MSTRSEAFLACRTRVDLAAVLEVKPSLLAYYAYGGGKKYTRFEIPKKSGGRREIFAPAGGLKSVQRQLAAILNEVYPAPTYANGFITKRGIVRNADPHVGKRVVLNFDLKDFFPSITASRVIGLFKAKPFCFSKEVASTLAGISCYNNILPQGAPTSPVISNMICFRLDRDLGALAREEKTSYTRYADDITFSSWRNKLPPSILKKDTEAGLALGGRLLSILGKNYFSVNDQKTRVSYGKKAQYVTGVKVNAKPNVSKTYVRQIRAMLNAFAKYGPKKAQTTYSVKYGGGNKNFVQVLRGKIAHLKNVKGDSDLVYRHLYNKFVGLEGKGKPTLPENEIEELYRKVFVVISGSKQGTGFILDGKYLVTCAHVLDGDEVEYFTHNDYPPVTRKKVKINRAWSSEIFDIALIAPHSSDCLSAKSFRACPVTEIIQPQQSYKAAGFPHYQTGMQPRIITLRVTGIDATKHGVQNAFIDQSLVRGNSGGPVFNNRNEVVGVIARGTYSEKTTDDWSGFAFIPLKEVRKFAAQIGIQL